MCWIAGVEAASLLSPCKGVGHSSSGVSIPKANHHIIRGDGADVLKGRKPSAAPAQPLYGVDLDHVELPNEISDFIGTAATVTLF